MFYDKFEKLCRARGVSPTKVVVDLGLGKANVTFWKNGSTPKNSTLKKIAEYFNVNPGYLLLEEGEIIPGRLNIIPIDDPESAYYRYNIEAADADALEIGRQIFRNAGIDVDESTAESRILAALNRLNADGLVRAAEHLEELSSNPRFVRPELLKDATWVITEEPFDDDEPTEPPEDKDGGEGT